MHGSRKRRFELALPRVEVPKALSDLTAQVASGLLLIAGEPVSIDDCVSLKIGIKHFGVSSLLKVTLKYPTLGPEALPTPESLETDVEPPDAGSEAGERVGSGGRLRYKSLKKRMKQTFKGLVTALRAGLAPDAATTAAFIADSRSMITYSGKGDAFYPAYAAEVDRLEQAAANDDIAAMTASVAALDRMKKECHSRHA